MIERARQMDRILRRVASPFCTWFHPNAEDFSGSYLGWLLVVVSVTIPLTMDADGARATRSRDPGSEQIDGQCSCQISS